MYVKSYSIKNLPKEVYDWCRRHNYGVDGYMREFLVHAIKYGKQGKEKLKDLKIYIAHKNGRRMGWSIAYRDHYMYSGKKMYQSYVLPSFRRKGVGTRLLKKATEDFGMLGVYVHDESCDFFSSNGLTESGKISGKRISNKKAKV